MNTYSNPIRFKPFKLSEVNNDNIVAVCTGQLHVPCKVWSCKIRLITCTACHVVCFSWSYYDMSLLVQLSILLQLCTFCEINEYSCGYLLSHSCQNVIQPNYSPLYAGAIQLVTSFSNPKFEQIFTLQKLLSTSWFPGRMSICWLILP